MKKILGMFLLSVAAAIMGAGIYSIIFEQAVIRKVYLPARDLQPTLSRYYEDNASHTYSSNVPYFDGKTIPTKRTEIPDFVMASQLALPAVVHVKSQVKGSGRDFGFPFKDLFGDDEDEYQGPRRGMAMGSGVIISPDGYIATNYHVIEGAEEVEVALFDNRTFQAEVIGTDVNTDLALLKVEGQDLPHLSFGDSDLVKVGEWVLAVGNPLNLTSTVTAGIVSAKGRNLDLLRKDSDYAIESFIQTDAVVNRGNSGGALVNLNGELVGINTAISSKTGYFAGYSFAIPSAIVRKVMEDILTFGEVQRGLLGVRIGTVNAELAEREGLSVLKGAYVSKVEENGGAARAGIQSGDVIVSVDGVDVGSSSELQEQVSLFRPGDAINIRVFRKDREQEFVVTLKSMEDIELPESQANFEYRGSVFRDLTYAEKDQYGLRQGVMVDRSEGKLARGGVKRGFIITEVNDQKITDIGDLELALDEAGDYVKLKGQYKRGEIDSYEFSW